MKRLLKAALTRYYHGKFARLGHGTWVNPTSFIKQKALISIGDHSFIGQKCYIAIVAPATLTIGKYVGISPFVKILGGDHNVRIVGKYFLDAHDGQNVPIVIEDDVMVGMDSLVLKGVTIGEGAIVGAGSVVSKNIPPYTIAVGNPARPVRLRFKPDDLARHLDQMKSRLQYAELIEAYRAAGLSV